MVEIYAVCGKWKLNDKCQWEFLVDTSKGGSLCEVDENITYVNLVETVIEDFGIGCSVQSGDITLSYELPLKMKSMVEDSPPIYLRNDRQVRTFINKVKGEPELIRLCITEPHRSIGSDMSVSVGHSDTSCSIAERGTHPFLLHDALDPTPVSVGCSLSTRVLDDLHVNKHFKNKQALMLKMRKWALEWKFEFKSLWSDKSRVILGCVDDKCSWRMRATKLGSSDFFVVKKYVHEHTCDTTHVNTNHRQATAKLLGTLICGEKKDGLKPKQIMEQVRKEHGVQIKYQKAWRVKEQAQKLIRGTPSSVTDIICAPQTTMQSRERPSKKRTRSDGELDVPCSKSRRPKCSRCDKEGHNKSTCIVPI